MLLPKNIELFLVAWGCNIQRLNINYVTLCHQAFKWDCKSTFLLPVCTHWLLAKAYNGLIMITAWYKIIYWRVVLLIIKLLLKTFRILLSWFFFFKVKIGGKGWEEGSCPLRIDCHWRGYVTLFAIFKEPNDFIFHQLKSRNNGPVLLFEILVIIVGVDTVSCLLFQRWTWPQTWKRRKRWANFYKF